MLDPSQIDFLQQELDKAVKKHKKINVTQLNMYFLNFLALFSRLGIIWT